MPWSVNVPSGTNPTDTFVFEHASTFLTDLAFLMALALSSCCFGNCLGCQCFACVAAYLLWKFMIACCVQSALFSCSLCGLLEYPTCMCDAAAARPARSCFNFRQRLYRSVCCGPKDMPFLFDDENSDANLGLTDAGACINETCQCTDFMHGPLMTIVLEGLFLAVDTCL